MANSSVLAGNNGVDRDRVTVQCWLVTVAEQCWLMHHAVTATGMAVTVILPMTDNFLFYQLATT